MTLLDDIIAHKRREVAASRSFVPLADMRRRADAARAPLDFLAAVAGPPVRVIAEVKRASPSAGHIRPPADPAAIARLYEQAGAAAVSVLTDRRYFSGSLEDLQAVRAATRLPVLRKDFIIDFYQVYEARACGADAVLVIAGAVQPPEVRDLVALTASLGMTALVEAHNEAQVDEAVWAGARLIGINNRDLATLAVDLETTMRLRPWIPPDIRVVSESGIETAGDVARVCRAGVDAILIGTALMASSDPAARLRVLMGAAQRAHTEGVTS